MELSDVFAVPAPTRFSIAGGFGMAVVLVSFVHAPDVIADTGPLGLVALDKWIHAGSYALIVFLLGYALLAKDFMLLYTIVVVAVVVGAGVELIQSTIPWRTMEEADVFANVVGAVAGLVAWTAARRLLPVTSRVESEETARGTGGD